MTPGMKRDIAVLATLTLVLGAALLIPTILFHLLKYTLTHRGRK